MKPSFHISRASQSSRNTSKKKHGDNCNRVTTSHSINQSGTTEGNHMFFGEKDKVLNESELLPKDKNFKSLLTSEKENENFSTNNIKLNTLDSKDHIKEVEPQSIRENETSLPLFENSEQNEDNPRAFMGTFGSWINDLFSGPNKRSHASSKAYPAPYQQETDSAKDPEYFKSINALKKQFRKKLKSETSVHVAGGDKSLELDFQKFCSHEKKLKKPKSQSSLYQAEYNEEFFDALEEKDFFSKFQDKTIKRQSDNIGSLAHEFNDGDTFKETIQLKKSADLKDLNLTKERKKTKRKNRVSKETEEFIFPASQDFRKKLLLNINDQENCKQFYKNTPIEIQHYGQGKSKSYQSSTRCYTTNSNLGKTLGNSQSKTIISIDNKFMSSHTIANEEKKSALTKKIRKTLCNNKTTTPGILDMERKSSSFVRVKSSKPAISIQTEPIKSDPKATSDELVKYLMKKVKVHHRPPSTKKKQQEKSLIPAVLPTNKNKFMQSATSSLVMSVLSKKEADAIQGKTSAIIPVNNKLVKTDTTAKPTFHNKTWNPKYNENNVRHEVKRINFQSNLNRSTYLSDETIDVDRENYVFDKNNMKNSKRLYANAKTELKDTSDKNVKREEVRTMLSNIDMRSNLYAHISRVKQNEIKKKSIKNMLNSVDVVQTPDLKENQSPRFQQQHELFKTSLKNNQQNINSDLLQDRKDNETDQNSSLSTQLIVVDDKFQLLPDEAKETVKCDLQNNLEESVSLSDKGEASELKVLDCLNMDDKEMNLSADKKTGMDRPMMHKDKMLKNKTLHYMKDGDKVFLGPLSDYCNEKQKDQFQSSICNTDLRQMKSIETVLLNRRFSTNILNDKIKQKKNRALVSNFKALSSYADDDCPPSPGKSSAQSDQNDPRIQEKKSPASGCSPKPDEKKEAVSGCGSKPEEKKDSTSSCNSKAEEKKPTACKKADDKDKDKDKGKDCGFEKSQKPKPVCDGEKTKG